MLIVFQLLFIDLVFGYGLNRFLASFIELLIFFYGAGYIYLRINKVYFNYKAIENNLNNYITYFFLNILKVVGILALMIINVFVALFLTFKVDLMYILIVFKDKIALVLCIYFIFMLIYIFISIYERIYYHEENKRFITYSSLIALGICLCLSITYLVFSLYILFISKSIGNSEALIKTNYLSNFISYFSKVFIPVFIVNLYYDVRKKFTISNEKTMLYIYFVISFSAFIITNSIKNYLFAYSLNFIDSQTFHEIAQIYEYINIVFNILHYVFLICLFVKLFKFLYKHKGLLLFICLISLLRIIILIISMIFEKTLITPIFEIISFIILFFVLLHYIKKPALNYNN